MKPPAPGVVMSEEERTQFLKTFSTYCYSADHTHCRHAPELDIWSTSNKSNRDLMINRDKRLNRWQQVRSNVLARDSAGVMFLVYLENEIHHTTAYPRITWCIVCNQRRKHIYIRSIESSTHNYRLLCNTCVPTILTIPAPHMKTPTNTATRAFYQPWLGSTKRTPLTGVLPR